MNLHEFADWQKTLFSTVAGSGFGFLASFVIEWYKKRKLPREEDRDAATQLISAAKENVATSQSIVDLLDNRLGKERTYYESLIERSKKECESQIGEMKRLYDDTISDLQAQIIKSNDEKATLSKQVDNLTLDKNALQKEVSELKERLRKYEKKETGELPPLSE